MSDKHLHPETGENLGRPVGDAPMGTPRWVKVSLFIAAGLLLLLVIFLLLGGGHGPGRHIAGSWPLDTIPFGSRWSLSA